MSNFTAPTFHPETGEVEQAHWMDDHFGRHEYGVRFPDGKVFTPYEAGLERVSPLAMKLINKLKEYKHKYEGLCK